MATRAQIEGELVTLATTALVESGISADPSADASPRAYFGGPLRSGLASLGITPADPFAIVDSDLSGIASADLPQLIAVAEVEALELALARLASTMIDVRTKDLEHKRSQYRDTLAALIKGKRDRLNATFGLSVCRPEAGVWDLDFQEPGDCTEFD